MKNNNEIYIGNKEFFYMIDNQIRKNMMKYEENILLPKTKKLLRDSEINELVELELFPPEGYYYKTEGLANYFNIIRNIQEYKPLYDRIVDTKELRDLKRITGNKLFGYVQSNRTESPLPRMKDIMTLCMDDENLFPKYAHHPWNIVKIYNNLSRYHRGNISLVSLAYLTQELECLIAGCETNILYREESFISGCAFMREEVIWDVKLDVESMGNLLINKYNKLIDSDMIVPDEINFNLLDRKCEIPRVAKLGFQRNTNEYYYWILDVDRNIKDLYSTELITTKSYGKN